MDRLESAAQTHPMGRKVGRTAGPEGYMSE